MPSFSRSKVVEIFENLGFNGAGTWNQERLLGRVKGLPRSMSDESLGDDELDRLVEEIVQCVKDGDEIVIVDDEAETSTDADVDEQEAPTKKKRGRPKKEATEATEQPATKPVKGKVPKKPAKAKKKAEPEWEDVADDVDVDEVPVEKMQGSSIVVDQHDVVFHLMSLPAGVICKIAYAAERGVSSDENAVQRGLKKSRVASVRDFVLRGGLFPGNIVLNWVKTDSLSCDAGSLMFFVQANSAQIIDGQHRVAGLAAAIAEDPSIADLEIPVTIYQGLGIEECANIFLSINTEQKTVPKNFVYELYGLASDYVVDQQSNQARELAIGLSQSKSSPYHGQLKDSTNKSGIALASMVSALKPFVGDKGLFVQFGFAGIEKQIKFLNAFFGVIHDWYGKDWDDTDNVFLTSAGFIGAVNFLRYQFLSYCVKNRVNSFKKMQELIDTDADLLLRSEMKGLGGAKARAVVADKLADVFDLSDEEQSEDED